MGRNLLTIQVSCALVVSRGSVWATNENSRNYPGKKLQRVQLCAEYLLVPRRRWKESTCSSWRPIWKAQRNMGRKGYVNWGHAWSKCKMHQRNELWCSEVISIFATRRWVGQNCTAFFLGILAPNDSPTQLQGNFCLVAFYASTCLLNCLSCRPKWFLVSLWNF